MKPIVSIIMGSTSDLPVMEKAAAFLNDMQVPFEMNALSAHRTPAEVEKFAKEAAGRGLKVIIAGACIAGCHCRQYHTARHRHPYQRFRPGRCRCLVFHPSDASGHPRGYGSHQRGDECRHPCRADARPV